MDNITQLKFHLKKHFKMHILCLHMSINYVLYIYKYIILIYMYFKSLQRVCSIFSCTVSVGLSWQCQLYDEKCANAEDEPVFS